MAAKKTAPKSNVKTYKSSKFITQPVRAVWPHLTEPDQFGSFSIDVDVLNNPEFRELIEAQAEEVLKAAHAKLETDKVPTNELVRSGVDKQKQPFQRISFKMKETRTVNGEEIEQKPRVVDSQRQPFSKFVGGGSLVKIAYFFQYTIMPTGGVFLSTKLDAVQVLELVVAGGEVPIDTLFAVEEGGYTDVQEEALYTPEVPSEDEPSEETEGKAKSGRDF